MSAFSVGTVLAHGGAMMWGGSGAWGWLWGIPVMLLVLAGVVAVVWVVARDGWRPRPAHGPSAQDILAERYARGEVSTEEFEQRRAALR